MWWLLFLILGIIGFLISLWMIHTNNTNNTTTPQWVLVMLATSSFLIIISLFVYMIQYNTETIEKIKKEREFTVKVMAVQEEVIG